MRKTSGLLLDHGYETVGLYAVREKGVVQFISEGNGKKPKRKGRPTNRLARSERAVTSFEGVVLGTS